MRTPIQPMPASLRAFMEDNLGRPWALDTFSGQGGMGKGLMDAGWAVYAVDTVPGHLAAHPSQWTHQGDAIEFILNWGHLFTYGHGSPTCTGYSQGTVALPDRLSRYDRLIPVVRAAFQEVGLPYTIENVYGARRELVDPILLCGRMFDLTATDTDGVVLTLDRHRLFESSLPLVAPPHIPHGWVSNRRDGVQVAGAYGAARRDKVEARQVRKGGYVPASLKVLHELLGTPWMDEEGCFLSVPPAYGENIGRQVLALLNLEEMTA